MKQTIIVALLAATLFGANAFASGRTDFTGVDQTKYSKATDTADFTLYAGNFQVDLTGNAPSVEVLLLFERPQNQVDAIRQQVIMNCNTQTMTTVNVAGRSELGKWYPLEDKEPLVKPLPANDNSIYGKVGHVICNVNGVAIADTQANARR